MKSFNKIYYAYKINTKHIMLSTMNLVVCRSATTCHGSPSIAAEPSTLTSGVGLGRLVSAHWNRESGP